MRVIAFFVRDEALSLVCARHCRMNCSGIAAFIAAPQSSGSGPACTYTPTTTTVVGDRTCQPHACARNHPPPPLAARVLEPRSTPCGVAKEVEATASPNRCLCLLRLGVVVR